MEVTELLPWFSFETPANWDATREEDHADGFKLCDFYDCEALEDIPGTEVKKGDRYDWIKLDLQQQTISGYRYPDEDQCIKLFEFKISMKPVLV